MSHNLQYRVLLKQSVGCKVTVEVLLNRRRSTVAPTRFPEGFDVTISPDEASNEDGISALRLATVASFVAGRKGVNGRTTALVSSG